jgi:DNA/RNA-binding domain of Phe-tRNA-synthetase-like protein
MIEEIKIAQELNKICNDVVLGCLRCQVKTQEKNLYLWEEVEVVCNKLVSQLTIEQLSKLPKIQKTREIYKKLGKDPSRYRVSSEALVRRILQGKDLYSINNVVDINNLASLNSLYPIGSYD